jgi:rod shape-determining protein MreD
MDEVSFTRLWLARAGFALLVLVLLFFRLLPLETAPHRWAGPDLVLSFLFAWALRRPEYTPMVLCAALLLLCDLLLDRAPGLYAALALLALLNLRTRANTLRAMPFGLEWITVSAALGFVLFGQWLILGLTLVDPPPISLVAIQFAASVICYPLTALTTRYVFGLRPIGLGEINALGQRQ